MQSQIGGNMRIGQFGLPELLIILVVVLLLFGAKRLPEIGSSLGRGIRTFKRSVTGEDENEKVESPSIDSRTGNDPPYGG
jgi:sec-independent protein translocase protein TatA